jgi:hypothetical protein
MKINFHNKLMWKSLAVFALVGVFVTFNQCVIQQYDGTTNTVNTNVDVQGGGEGEEEALVPEPTGGQNEFVETGATEVAKLYTSVGHKDFEQIYMSMSIVTGIDVQDESGIRSRYTILNSQLPADNSIKNFGTAHQIAVIKLASEFCDRFINNSSYYQDALPGINFNTSYAQQLYNGNNTKIDLIQKMINKFWGVNVQPDTVVQSAINENIQLITDVQGEESDPDSQNTGRKAGKAVCTSLLSSAPITLL